VSPPSGVFGGCRVAGHEVLADQALTFDDSTALLELADEHGDQVDGLGLSDLDRGLFDLGRPGLACAASGGPLRPGRSEESAAVERIGAHPLLSSRQLERPASRRSWHATAIGTGRLQPSLSGRLGPPHAEQAESLLVSGCQQATTTLNGKSRTVPSTS
jgi:hypothetical protein